MEARNTQTATRYQPDFNSIADYDGGDKLAQQRLEKLLAINAETVREKSLFHSEREKTEAAMMKKPLNTVQAFSYFGLVLGLFSPAAIFGRILIDSSGLRGEDVWILGVLAIVNILSAVVGFFSGKLIGKMVREVENFSWGMMIFMLPFVGVLWGIITGGASGIIILIVGAFFGAILGAAVGSAALPAFTVLHRLLKKGDVIDRKLFLPMAFGITFIICGFILGL